MIRLVILYAITPKVGATWPGSRRSQILGVLRAVNHLLFSLLDGSTVGSALHLPRNWSDAVKDQGESRDSRAQSLDGHVIACIVLYPVDRARETTVFEGSEGTTC
jgi:hypothetical protein